MSPMSCLCHFLTLCDTSALPSPTGRPHDYLPQTRRAPIQVLTDVDDTIKSSGGVTLQGVYLGGIDGQYPRGEFYPGVFRSGGRVSRWGLLASRSYFPAFEGLWEGDPLLSVGTLMKMDQYWPTRPTMGL